MSTNQCPFQVMVQNALLATSMVNSIIFHSAWQLRCPLVNLDLMSCQNKNVDWWYERASDLTIEKCIYVYTILFVPAYGTSQTPSDLCTAFDLVSKFTPGKNNH